MWCSICHADYPITGSTACITCINKLVEEYHKEA